MFKVLAVGSRIKIIELLKEHGSMCVCDISKELDISSSAVSQHLKILRFAGLVNSERNGYWVSYSIVPDALERCHTHLSEICSCECCDCSTSESAPEEAEEEVEDELAVLRAYSDELKEKLSKALERIVQLEEKDI